jgi:hypothetical protein
MPPAPLPAPPPSTIGVLLTDALVTAGIVGLDEAVEAEVLNKAMRISNRMIAQWQHERYMVYQLVDYGFVSTGSLTYTVGLGQNYNINPRPDRLEYAFLRQISNGNSTINGSDFNADFNADFGGQTFENVPQPFDWPLEIINAHEDYASIRLKTLGTFSAAVFYDPGMPIGLLFPWPVPQASIYEIHILVKQTLQRFVNVEQAITFPPEYEAALEWCLARRFCEAFQMPARPGLNELAA